jgi:diguanylate cyclase (GGDEF)-like protein/PAS domain S-box-containing protein
MNDRDGGLAKQACELLFELSKDGVFLADEDGRIREANPALCAMLGTDLGALDGTLYDDHLAPGSVDFAHMTRAGAQGYRVETMLRRADGRTFSAEVSLKTFGEDQGSLVVATIHDVTARRAAAEDLEFKSLLLDSTKDAVIVHTLEGRLLYANRTAYESQGFTREEFMALPPYGWISPEFRAGVSVRRDELESARSLSFDSVNMRKDGTSIPVEVNARFVQIRGEDCAVSVVRDVTERRKAEKLIRHMAFHDMLTGLPNRKLFHDRLADGMAEVRRAGSLLCVLFVDLDDFKPINDTYGHVLGDKLLAAVADRLSRCVREGDTLARYGGDEFVILLPDMRRERDASKIAEELLVALDEPFQVDGMTLRVSASVGGALCHTGEEDVDSLLRAADSAMYRAKELETSCPLFHRVDPHGQPGCAWPSAPADLVPEEA